MKTEQRLYFWRGVLALTIVLAVASMMGLARTADHYHIRILHSNWIFIFIGLLAITAAVAVILILTWTSVEPLWIRRIDGLAASTIWRKIGAVVILAILPVALVTVIFQPYYRKFYLSDVSARLLLFWWLAAIGMFCLKAITRKLSWPTALVMSALMLGVIYRIAGAFSLVSNYPFSQGWSEVSRFYGASLFFSERLYGAKIPLPLLHPAWHLLLAPLFLFGNLPIWVYRFWQALLQVSLTLGLGWAVAKRYKVNGSKRMVLVIAWAFLFLMQGPILIHLLVCALSVVAGIRPEKFWRTTFIVIAASLWAGWTRINWFPVPGLLAATIYFLELPVRDPKHWLKYLRAPFLWFTLGTLLAFASNLAFVRWLSNGSGGNFTSSISSGLLWYRLLPNTTYPDGVLLDAVLVSSPLLLATFFGIRARRSQFHPVRLAGIGAILLVLFAGGLVVSAKIGGGSDLHNLDAYLILLMLVGGYFFFYDQEPEPAKIEPRIHYPFPMKSLLLILGVALPLWFAFNYGEDANFTWNKTQAERVLSILKGKVESTASIGGQVLFISQRQMLALKMVNVPVAPEYEQDALMEMVLSQNRPYLDKFQEDLKAQRFALIVAEKQGTNIYGKTGYFGEENDLWVRDVSIPLLCYYQPLMEPGDFGVVLYSPREDPCK